MARPALARSVRVIERAESVSAAMPKAAPALCGSVGMRSYILKCVSVAVPLSITITANCAGLSALAIGNFTACVNVLCIWVESVCGREVTGLTLATLSAIEVAELVAPTWCLALATLILYLIPC